MQREGFLKSAKPQATVLGADVFAWFGDNRVKQITPGDGIYIHPCIHPSGEEVIFFGAVSGPAVIYRARLESGEMRALTEPTNCCDNAVFSWDGGKIVFCSDRNSGREPATIIDVAKFPPAEEGAINVFTMDGDGSNVRQVTSGAFQDQRPCFSPDGKTIVFASNRKSGGGDFHLWTVSADGSKEPKLLNPDVLGYRPWFSADGKWIYFFTDTGGGRHQICRMPADGGDYTIFKNDDAGLSHGPFVDPGGEVLLMHSNRSGIWNIWELPLDSVSPPRMLQPPGFEKATHPTRAKNGVITFDVWKVEN
jgi:Tol biopolymer transport system component